MFECTAYLLFIAYNITREILRFYFRTTKVTVRLEDQGSSVMIVVHSCIVLVAPFLSLIGHNNFTHFVAQSFGVSLMLMGIIVHIMAMATLKQYYTGTLVTVHKHSIVDTGLYGYIRHPGYLGVLLISVGFGLAVGNWLALVVISISFAVTYSYRIEKEEEMLIKSFGARYVNYKKRTKTIVPFVL